MSKSSKQADSEQHRLEALQIAVSLLRPFNRRFKKMPGLDASELLAIDPETLARSSVENLADQLTKLLKSAPLAPRTKEIRRTLKQLRSKLQDIRSRMTSLDFWSRLHLHSLSEPQLPDRLLPPLGGIGCGGFAEDAARIARKIDSLLLTLPADLGGPHSHYERFLGDVKTIFVREAFDLFDSYHPRTASSDEGGPFHTFIHKVYEYATGVHDEGKAGLSHRVRSLITPLHKYQKADESYWAIEMKIIGLGTNRREYAKLRARQDRFSKQKQELETQFVPALARAEKRQPRQKNRR